MILKKLYKRYLCWQYGVCPIHLTLMRAGGGYEPTWICDTCIKENEAKHVYRQETNNMRRIEAEKKVRILDRESHW